MEYTNVIEGKGINKRYGKFVLDIPSLEVPKGFATALIGENGAGKSTLMDILTGILLDAKGDLKYFGEYSAKDRENSYDVKNRIGYVGSKGYYFPQWTIREINDINKVLFDNYSEEKFMRLLNELSVFPNGGIDLKKKNSLLSDGNQMKTMLAGVFARNTDMLILDEPASPLDPLMRDVLCQMIRSYVCEGNGDKSVLFSTHNIADMENVTDYAIIIENGSIVESGFVEDLKEKYILVRGDAAQQEAISQHLYTVTASQFGFSGIMLSDDLDSIAGTGVVTEQATLSQICVAVMRHNTKLDYCPVI